MRALLALNVVFPLVVYSVSNLPGMTTKPTCRETVWEWYEHETPETIEQAALLESTQTTLGTDDILFARQNTYKLNIHKFE